MSDDVLDTDWKTDRVALAELLRTVGASDASDTEMIFLYPVDIWTEEEEPKARLKIQALHDMGMQLAVRGGTDRYRTFAYESRPGSQDELGVFLWLTAHSHLAAWWLLTAWRISELADSVRSMFDQQLIIPAASCARSLLETVAQVRLDVSKIGSLWDECRSLPPSAAQPLPSNQYHELVNQIAMMLYGGQWPDDNQPAQLRVFGESPRRPSIQTPIGKLAKAEPETTDIYAYLSNVVHPSVMGHMAYIDEVTDHSPGERRIGFRRDSCWTLQADGGNHMMPITIARSMRLSLRTAMQALDDGLHIIDDLALTTGATTVARTRYWRGRVQEPDRNAACPCRSGLKAKKCDHRWGNRRRVNPQPGQD